MDNIDHKIIEALQKNARLSNQQLADKVSLSPSPCLRRVKKLEDTGVIKGYTANIDLPKIGLNINVMINVRLEKHSQSLVNKFEKGILQLDEVVTCYLVSGKSDYLLHVVTTDFRAYELFVRNQLQRVPGIGFLESNFIFDEIKHKASV